MSHEESFNGAHVKIVLTKIIQILQSKYIAKMVCLIKIMFTAHLHDSSQKDNQITLKWANVFSRKSQNCYKNGLPENIHWNLMCSFSSRKKIILSGFQQKQGFEKFIYIKILQYLDYHNFVITHFFMNQLLPMIDSKVHRSKNETWKELVYCDFFS